MLDVTRPPVEFLPDVFKVIQLVMSPILWLVELLQREIKIGRFCLGAWVFKVCFEWRFKLFDVIKFIADLVSLVLDIGLRLARGRF